MTIKANKSWYLYLIRTAQGQLYTGVTVDLSRRFQEHQQGGPRAAKYLKGKGPLTLAYSCEVGERSKAHQLEYQLKHWPKARKEALVASQCPLSQFLLATSSV